jgi:hypothetical protein
MTRTTARGGGDTTGEDVQSNNIHQSTCQPAVRPREFTRRARDSARIRTRTCVLTFKVTIGNTPMMHVRTDTKRRIQANVNRVKKKKNSLKNGDT